MVRQESLAAGSATVNLTAAYPAPLSPSSCGASHATAVFVSTAI